MGASGDFLIKNVLTARWGAPEIHLANAGIAPEEIDYITFDHLHVQDLRGWIGPGGRFPRARLLVQREELETLAEPAPLQAIWYVEGGLAGIAPERIITLDEDVLLGPGVALVRTPGHTRGNHSIVLNTDDGIWVISENGVSVDAMNPRASRIAGLEAHHLHAVGHHHVGRRAPGRAAQGEAGRVGERDEVAGAHPGHPRRLAGRL